MTTSATPAGDASTPTAPLTGGAPATPSAPTGGASAPPAASTPSAAALSAPSARTRGASAPSVRRRSAPLGAAVVAGVLLLAAGCGGRATTHHKPGTSHEQSTGSHGTVLADRDESGHRLRELPADEAPSVRAEARPDSEGGWNVHLTVERFRFTPESTGGGALTGRGHARLLVDGREAARAYGPWFHLPPGARSLTVRLHADDHTVWAVAGKPVQTTLALTAAPSSSASLTPTASPTPTPPYASPTAPDPAPTGRTLDIRVSGSTVTPAPSRVEVKKGERVTLRVTSDRADTVHVHGYDREATVAPGAPAVLALTADRTGLFEVETHGSGLVLTQLVVR
ncbi:hypothetical protein ACFWIN_32010 [Streptomyces sp. NPDC127049]|uniref:hypothetical protein n=1 Tax=Streptomyces sp. NPDC127049 TaxID=3347118 RepID=UPI0036493125